MPNRRSPDDPPFLRPKPLTHGLHRIPRGVFIATASHDDRRLGLHVNFVQIAATEPPSVSLALPKGQPISPLIRDSRAFGLCVLSHNDTHIANRFNDHRPDDPDPFDAFDARTLETGSPLLPRAIACLDCRVSMHIDFESDHELYIAHIVSSHIAEDAEPSAVITDHE